jgi:hypothetical protein
VLIRSGKTIYHTISFFVIIFDPILSAVKSYPVDDVYYYLAEAPLSIQLPRFESYNTFLTTYFRLKNIDGSEIDKHTFKFDPETLVMTVQTSNEKALGVHNFEYISYYSNSTPFNDSRQFSVSILHFCMKNLI